MEKLKIFFQKIFLDKESKQKIEFLKQLPIFDGVTDRALYQIMNIMYRKTYPPNEIIFKEGDIGKAVFIIKSGEVVILKSAKEEKILTKLTAGDFFGEMALLDEFPRSATAKTTKESELYFIYKVRFDALLKYYPRGASRVIYNLARLISARLRHTTEDYVKSF